MKKAIGKNTLGQGEKMKVDIHGYELSTHDLSEVRKTTMAPGLLNPVYQTIGLPGDKFEIDLYADIYTEPTVGPNFDSFKYQVDVFKADLRLYQSMLQNNELDAGMNIASVTLPQLVLTAGNTKPNDYIDSNSQSNPSGVLSRLGIKGLGHSEQAGTIIQREFNATFWLAYWDIFKNFYANKQEKKAYVVHNEIPEDYENDIVTVKYNKPTFPTENIAKAPTPTAPPLQPLAPGCEVLIEMPIGYNMEGVYPEYMLFNLVKPGETAQVNAMEIFNEKVRYQPGIIVDVWVLVGVKPEWFGWSIDNYEMVPYESIETLPPRLQEFDLTNLDDMRRQILSSSAGITLDQTSIAPYGWALEYKTINATTKTSAQGTQEGLATKTYQSDLFNNWIRTEFVDTTNLKTTINVTAGLSMESLALAKRMWELENRISISGGSIDDYIETVWASGRPNNVTTPEYMGGMSREIEFEAVTSTSDTAGAPLGQLGGRGKTAREKNGGKIRIVVGASPCVILVIASITPRIGYSQGNDWTNNLKTMADLHVPALDGIGYQHLITDQFDWRDTEMYNGLTQPAFRSVGYQPAWLNYTTGYNKIDGNFAYLDKTGFMVNDRHYEWSKALPMAAVGTKDKTTYIDPTHFNYTFVNTRLDAMNFWVMTGIKNIARRKMSARQIPNL